MNPDRRSYLWHRTSPLYPWEQTEHLRESLRITHMQSHQRYQPINQFPSLVYNNQDLSCVKSDSRGKVPQSHLRAGSTTLRFRINKRKRVPLKIAAWSVRTLLDCRINRRPERRTAIIDRMKTRIFSEGSEIAKSCKVLNLDSLSNKEWICRIDLYKPELLSHGHWSQRGNCIAKDEISRKANQPYQYLYFLPFDSYRYSKRYIL